MHHIPDPSISIPCLLIFAVRSVNAAYLRPAKHSSPCGCCSFVPGPHCRHHPRRHGSWEESKRLCALASHRSIVCRDMRRAVPALRTRCMCAMLVVVLVLFVGVFVGVFMGVVLRLFLCPFWGAALRARTPVCPCASSRIHRQPHRYAVAKKAKKYATAERLRYRCTLSLQDLFIWDTFAATTHQSSSTCSNLHSVLGQPASILPQACPDVCLDLACFTTRP